jgi:hypothetical protein
MKVKSDGKLDGEQFGNQRQVTMKTGLVYIISIGVLAGLVGCAPAREKTRAANPRTMGFSQAGVSLVLGDEWQANNSTSSHSAQPPTLVSPAGVIRVVLLPPDRAEPATVADGLRASFDASPKAAKHSFRRQEFASKSGVQGICVSYLQLAEKDGRVNEVQNSHFLVKNRGGRCVVINYLASAADNSDAINRTIRSTLALQ